MHKPATPPFNNMTQEEFEAFCGSVFEIYNEKKAEADAAAAETTTEPAPAS